MFCLFCCEPSISLPFWRTLYLGKATHFILMGGLLGFASFVLPIAMFGVFFLLPEHLSSCKHKIYIVYSKQLFKQPDIRGDN